MDLVNHPDLEVPTASGGGAPINQLPVTAIKKTLGLNKNPAGIGAKQVDVLVDTVQTWIDKLCASRLPEKWACVSYRPQLWPKMNFGLGTNASTLDEIKDIEDKKGDRPTREDDDPKHRRRKLSLRAIYRKMLSKLSVNKNVKYGWRHVSQLFGGIGLRRMLPEISIA